jgi:hypothetical protein
MPPLPARAVRESPSPAEGGGAELVVSAGKFRRVSGERWGKRKEAIFFEELAATANATLAAEAAGVSSNAVFARRLKHPVFAAKWNAVVRASQASIDLYLVEETRKTFDPDSLDTGEVTPRVTIDQAIKISQLNASKSAREASNPFAGQAASMSGEGVEAVRERLLKKFMRLRDRLQGEDLAAGWSYDERFDVTVPPGYVQGPDYEPHPED